MEITTHAGKNEITGIVIPITVMRMPIRAIIMPENTVISIASIIY